MLCNHCQKKLATVHMAKLEDGQASKVQLCEDCANQLVSSGVGVPPLADLIGSIPLILASMSGDNPPPGTDAIADIAQQTVKCEACGSSFEDLRETGRVGCGECYEAFDERISPLIQRVHGSEVHTGKIPSRTGAHIVAEKRVSELSDLLNRLVLSEEFERAAQVRDQIRDLRSRVGVTDE